MKLLNASALLLDVVDLQEKDRVVTFLTADHGKKRGTARGSRTKYSRFAGQLQPLARVTVSWAEKEERDLVRISDVALERPAVGLQKDLEGILLGSYLAEQMSEFALENEPSEKLFRLLDSTLDALLEGADRRLAARYYEIWILRLAGIFPVPRECPLCGDAYADQAVLIESEGALVCPSCGGADRRVVTAAELDFLRRSAKQNLKQIAPPTPQILARLEDLCARIRRSFLQKELKSYRVMRETLGSLG